MDPLGAFRRLGRSGRRLLRGNRAGNPWFLYHSDYRRALSGVPMDALRGERVLTWLLDEGWVSPRRVLLPRPASMENLLRVHSADYLRSLEDPAEVGRILGLTVSAEEARAALSMQRLAAGGTIQALRLALRSGRVAMHLGGGFHHASGSRGTGFCLLNDVAVGIRRLRARGFDAPILVVDLDLHDGNGTRAIFAEDPTVHTLSLHNQPWDTPEALAGAVADTSVALGPGVEDGPYLEALRGTLPEVVASHRPALTVYVAGVDPGADDSYGDGRLTRAGLLERDRFVTRTVRASGAMAVVLAGGYGPSAWRATARFAGWLATGQVEEPPDDLRVALQRADRPWLPPEPRRPFDPLGFREPLTFSLSPEDLSAAGAADPGPALLLERFDLARIQKDLERFGLLPQLRNRGYPHPEVELKAATGLGPVVRVWGEPACRHLLVELRVEIDRNTLPGHPMLRVEWLLLQDPRAAFTPARPPLPGQEHPGLGSLSDMVAWLVTLCRELELHGILFRTTHWHVVALAERHVHFLSEEDAVAFRRRRKRPAAPPPDGGGSGVSATGRAAGASEPWPDIPLVIPVGTGLEGRTWPSTEPSAGANLTP